MGESVVMILMNQIDQNQGPITGKSCKFWVMELPKGILVGM